MGLKRAFDQNFNYALVLNNDIAIPDKEFLYKIYTKIESSDYALIGPQIIEKDRAQLPLYKNRPGFLKIFLENCLVIPNIILKKTLRKYSKHNSSDVYAVSGCCFIANLTVLNKVNYFDEFLFLYGEELVLSEKLFRLNESIYYYTDAVVYHNHSQTIGKSYDLNKIFMMQNKSFMYYCNTYREDFSKLNKKLIKLSLEIRRKIILTLKRIK